MFSSYIPQTLQVLWASIHKQLWRQLLAEARPEGVRPGRQEGEHVTVPVPSEILPRGL